MPDISVMVKPVSGLCNMRCSYCFYQDEVAHRAEGMLPCMEEATMKRVVKETLKFAENSCTYLFQGGEPALAGIPFYKKWLEYENRYNVNQVQIHHSIQTNGTLLDDPWYDFLEENHFLTGISLDGIQETHDIHRKDGKGSPTYANVLAAVEQCRRRGIDYNILTVVTNELASQAEAVYRFYKEQGFEYQQYIACLDPLDKKSGSCHGFLNPKRYGEFLITIFRLWKADFLRGTPPSIRLFENYLCMLLDMPIESCEQRGICGCQTVIESDGSVYPCDFYALDEYKIGNLMYEDMQTIEKMRRKKQFVETSCNHSDGCKCCKYFLLCRGGCRRHRDITNRKDGNNRFCTSYQMFFDACLSELLQLAEMIKYRHAL